MPHLLQQYQKVSLTMLNKLSRKTFKFLEDAGWVGWSRPFLPKRRTDLLCCDGFAVDFYSFTRRASHIGP